MHEVALMEEALRRAACAAAQAGARRIERLTFAIVAGGHVSRASVETLFAALSPGTAAAGAALEVRWQPARRYCPVCGAEYTCTVLDTCPGCGEEGLPGPAQPELRLASIDVAD